jgi:hypothetical protein
MSEYSDNSRHESKYDHLDPEQRIAMLKSQKEKEKQKEIAEKEMAMKMAIEANRAEQRRKSGDTTNRAKAIAFDIDITSDKTEPKNMKVRGGGSGPGSSGAATPSDSEHQQPSSQKSNQSVVTNYPSSRRTPTQEIESSSNNRSRDGTPNSLENISTKSNPSTSGKKGWGPPVDGKEILQARARGLSGLMSPDADEGSENPTPKTATTTAGDGEENDEVMKRIESKRRSQLEVRHQAKEVLSKLREQRQMQAAKIRQQQQEKQKEQFQQSASSSIKRTISPLRVRALESLSSAETTKESTAKSTAEKSGTPQRISLVERMKEKRESESKQRSRSQSPAIVATPPPQQVKQNSRSNSFTGQEEKDTSEHDQIHQNKLNAIEELSEELEDTLRTWLDHQKRGVTVRKKPSVAKMLPTAPTAVAPQKGPSASQSEFKDEFESDGGFDSGFESDGNNNGHVKHVHEEDDIGVYKTINNNRDERKKLYDHDDIEEHLMSPSYQEDVISPYDINKPLKGKYMDEDVEVVGMQCMLAKALMGDDDD